MLPYYLVIDTDGDFGIKINDQEIWEYIKIKAKNHDKLIHAVKNMEFISKDNTDNDVAKEFIEDLKNEIVETNGFRGGNWTYDFGPLIWPDWDIELL